MLRTTRSGLPRPFGARNDKRHLRESNPIEADLSNYFFTYVLVFLFLFMARSRIVLDVHEDKQALGNRT